MDKIGITSLIIIVINGIVTNKGLSNPLYLDKYSLNIREILIGKDYIRILSSGFLHVNWTHFIFNMYSLYIFGESLELEIGLLSYLTIYFLSLIGGNLLGLLIHKNHPDYKAVGASGAISGIVFASIALFPTLEIGLLIFPVKIAGWLFGLIYILYTIYGIKSQKDNIGHEAHLGGGIIGLITAVIIFPEILTANYIPIVLILVPSLLFLYLIIIKPYILILPNPFTKPKGIQTFEDKYNSKKVNTQNEIDKILDKISKKGLNNISKKDKKRLDELTK